MSNKLYSYHPDGLSFTSKNAFHIRRLQFPLCGIDSNGIKSSITPYLSGDIKTDKDHFLTKPTSREDLLDDVRNFFVFLEGKGVYSLTDALEDGSSEVEIGQLWHKVIKKFSDVGLTFEVLNFVPVTGEQAELMHIKCTNNGSEKLNITPTAAIPIFGRGLANKHDHEHVTALLHNIEQLPNGVLVRPRMSFNEEGHRVNATVYYVFGFEGDAQAPVGSFPTVDRFYGESGYARKPEAVYQNIDSKKLEPIEINGKEAVGALRFETIELQPGESKDYYIMMGIADDKQQAQSNFSQFSSANQFATALQANKDHWTGLSKAITLKTGDQDHDSWMSWVTLQPVLRRIFGCSFLPDHDYGKGGKGWRDIWQDLLSLILIEPEHVRETLINNFSGVRIDGSNATIVGERVGEFVADRNAISRVWMDHGAWPLKTLGLYINQTGDYDILLEEMPYFKDPQLSRSFEKDWGWNSAYGQELKSKDSTVYRGTIIEHVLVQHLVQFFNVGEHNCCRLENADWNDGLDMAFERGESVTFMSFYAGNCFECADLLETLAERKDLKTVLLLKEVTALLNPSINYDSIEEKKKLIFESYFPSVQPEVSGERVEIAIADVIANLRKKGQWIFDHIRKQEIIRAGDHQWFNGYYDNEAQQVEGEHNGSVRMTLTGQVFPIMSGLASEDEIKSVIKATNAYLKDEVLGGVRLNTDFGVDHYLDLGRAFSFAYGTKENGSFFSHMSVMYAYALYSRGFVKEGYEVLNAIYKMSVDTDKSKIYPGVPEYFDSQGRGMYHFLTGSASWLVLTKLTQVFGIRGSGGDLLIEPKLVKDEFDQSGQAAATCQFAGKNLTVTYKNEDRLESGEYAIKEVCLNDSPVEYNTLAANKITVSRALIENASDACHLSVSLCQKG